MIPDSASSLVQMVSTISVFLFVIFNGLQGVFILGIFVTNKRVLKLYKTAWQSILKSAAPAAAKKGPKECRCKCPVHPQATAAAKEQQLDRATHFLPIDAGQLLWGLTAKPLGPLPPGERQELFIRDCGQRVRTASSRWAGQE